MALERTIQSKILKYLKDIGSYTFKAISTNKKGVPDIICLYNGKYIALEVKNEKGKLTELQDFNLREIKKNGGYAYCVRSVEEVKEIFDKRINNG